MEPRTRSAGVIVVRRAPSGWQYLLLRAYRYWDFPKGLVEPGEDPLAAAEREVEEETGLRGLHFRWGSGYCETEPYARNKVARYYLAEAPEAAEVHLPVSPALGRPEHHEFRWLSHEEAHALLGPRLVPILDWARVRIAGEGP
jgi:8-oxo-dGTP pyrophosphatase MutT (NUDIX family)